MVEADVSEFGFGEGGEEVGVGDGGEGGDVGGRVAASLGDSDGAGFDDSFEMVVVEHAADTLANILSKDY